MTEPARSPTARDLQGPSLVALGAAGWGSELIFRRNLSTRLAPYPIVLLEHIVQVIYTLPWLLRYAWLWRRIPRRALWWVLLSGGIGSSLGTVCFTAAMAPSAGVNSTAAVVLLNLQPVISTAAGAVLFGERIFRRFYLWAALAMLAGAAIAVGDGSYTKLRDAHLAPGFLYVGATIVLWGFATAAGRGAMRELPLGLATPLRLWAGLFTTAIVLGLRSLAGHGGLDLHPLADARVLRDLLLLTSVAGVIPLFVYFAGLRTTPAAVAGYCEMFYTVSGALLSWAFLGSALNPIQIVATAVLVVAIIGLNRAQEPSAAPAEQWKAA
jgi:DME family drug/metabolite transporter